jgi:hypothetical protein
MSMILVNKSKQAEIVRIVNLSTSINPLNSLSGIKMILSEGRKPWLYLRSKNKRTIPVINTTAPITDHKILGFSGNFSSDHGLNLISSRLSSRLRVLHSTQVQADGCFPLIYSLSLNGILFYPLERAANHRDHVENILSGLHSLWVVVVLDNIYLNIQIYDLYRYTIGSAIHILGNYQVLNLLVIWLACLYLLQSIRQPFGIYLLLASLGVVLHWLGHTHNDDKLCHQERLNIHILGKVSSCIK